MANEAKCELCGELMPAGEEMFKFHGYSGDCPKPIQPKEASRADAILAHIGPFIAQRRAELGLSLDDVARLSGCTKSHVWEVEQGRSRNPTIRLALSMCEALQCSLNTLLGCDVSQPIISDDELELVAAYRVIRDRLATQGRE